MEEKHIEQMNEGMLYFAIESLGGQIWFYEHGLADGRIPEDPSLDVALLEMRQIQRKAVAQLPKFGIDSLGDSDRPTEAYLQWYQRWNHWHKNELSDNEWERVQEALKACQEDETYCLPDWAKPIK